MRSVFRIMMVVLLALSFVLGLVALLNYFKFQSSLLSLTERRLSVITAEARESLEFGLGLGLNLKHFDGAGAILRRARRLDDGIRALHVFSDDGRVLYSTEDSAIGTRIDREWLDARRQAAAAGAWRLMTGRELVLGSRLDASFAQGVGGIALVYPLDGVAARVGEMRLELMVTAALTLLGFSVLGAGAAILAARRLEAVCHGLSREVDGTLEGGALEVGAAGSNVSPVTSPAGGSVPLPGPMQLAARHFHDSVERAHAEIAEVERALAGVLDASRNGERTDGPGPSPTPTPAPGPALMMRGAAP